jgi:triosephosphate isomerase
MRKKIVAANWKMNKNLHEAILLADDIRIGLESLDKVKMPLVILAPPFPFLYPVSQTLTANPAIALAAQNCSAEKAGAFTGEVSADMIRSTGAKYVILGHSERRAQFAEGDALLKKKVKMALDSELNPIFCVGESLAERNEKRYFDVVEKHLSQSLLGLEEKHIRRLVIAYEPVWAIGTGMTASTHQVVEMHGFIRSFIAKNWSPACADVQPILYGGSCNAGNAAELFAAADVDGGLIGGASLKAADFLAIVKAAC